MDRLLLRALRSWGLGALMFEIRSEAWCRCTDFEIVFGENFKTMAGRHTSFMAGLNLKDLIEFHCQPPVKASHNGVFLQGRNNYSAMVRQVYQHHCHSLRTRPDTRSVR